MEADKKVKRAEKKRAANEMLRLELETVRESMTDMLDRFKIKMDADLARLISASQANDLSVSSAEAMLKQLHGLKIKPAKGRAKDFERIEELTEDLLKRLPQGGQAAQST